MKKSEKILASILTMVIGVLLIAMKGDFIGILMTIAGVSLIVLGAIDLFTHALPSAVVKIVSGVLVIVCGWTLVEAVLYIVSALLLIVGILLLCDKLKKKLRCKSIWYASLEYATPIACILIGCLFLFHQTLAIELVFILGGVLALIEGAVLLVDAFLEE